MDVSDHDISWFPENINHDETKVKPWLSEFLLGCLFEFTYDPGGMQWAAVSTKFLLMRAPPHPNVKEGTSVP